MSNDDWMPVTHGTCKSVTGPFYHGTKALLAIGDLLVPGHASNFEEGRISNNIYFTAVLEAAIWGAELAVALSNTDARGRIYIVEPTGTFEDDPNLTNKRFPGNRTQSYRTRDPLKIVGILENWAGHSPEVLQARLNSLADLRRRGQATIED